MTVDVTQNIKTLGMEILAEFKKKLGEVNLTDDEIKIALFAAEQVASYFVLGAGAPEDQKKILETKRDMGLASMDNVAVAKAIQVQRAMREAAQSALLKILQAAIGIALVI